MPSMKEYTKTLARRKKDSRAYTRHQATGAELAELLRDKAHTAIYIAYAKRFDEGLLRSLAKTAAENAGVRNRGAYFMRLLQLAPKRARIFPKKPQTKKQQSLFKWKKKR